MIMKRLLTIICALLISTACERENTFVFPEIGEINANTTDGIYQIATSTSFVIYENGIPVKIGVPEDFDSYYPTTINVYSYLRIKDGKLDLLHEYECKECGAKKIFCWEFYHTPIDLQNRLIWQDAMEIYKFTNDEIILIESMEKATKVDNKNFWRQYDSYKRVAEDEKFETITYVKHNDNPIEQEKIDFCENNNCKNN